MAPVADARSPARIAGRELYIVRTFPAPPALVFRAWTEADLILRWMCPNNFTVVSAEADARVGGAWKAHLRSPAGDDMWHHGTYQAVEAPTRLVLTHIWSGAHPNPNHETLITIDFAERDGQTVMTFRQAVFQHQEARDDHHGGWGEAFDKLVGIWS